MNTIDIKKTTIDDKISRMFEIIKKGLILNKESLNLYGINDNEIEEYINKNILIIRDDNCYDISLADSLHKYGVKLLTIGNIASALNCFDKCLNIKSNDRDYYLDLIYVLVKNKCYVPAIKYYTYMDNIFGNIYDTDNYLYLYLINMITNCSQYHKNVIDSVDRDVLIRNISKLGLENQDYQIRKSIALDKFKYAYYLINNKLTRMRSLTNEDKLFRELLCQTVDLEEEYKNKIWVYIKEEKYDLILKLFREKRNHRYLNSSEIYVEVLCEILININNTRIIPIIKLNNTNYLYDAIKGNNFILAREINRNFIKRGKEKRSFDDDMVDVLLCRTIDLINEIKIESVLDLDNKLDNEKMKDNTDDDIFMFIEDRSLLDFIDYCNTNNIDLDSEVNKLSLPIDKILLIKLIVARDSYLKGLHSKGDMYLNDIIVSNYRDNNINNLINAIIKIRDDIVENINDIKILKREK